MAAFGFGASVLGTLIARDAVATDQVANNPLSRESHFPAKAKRVIFIFCGGGPSLQSIVLCSMTELSLVDIP